MLILLILLPAIAIAVGLAFSGREGRRALVVLGCLLGAAVLGLWGYDHFRRPYLVASWLNLERPPESLSVMDCQDAMIPTDVDSNCMVSIDPEHFSELLRGYDFDYQSTHASEVILATGVREFEVADTYSVTPSKFKYGGLVVVYANAQRNRAIVNLYVE